MNAKEQKLLYKYWMSLELDLEEMRRAVSKEERLPQGIRAKPSVWRAFGRACDVEDFKIVDAIEFLMLKFIKTVEEQQKKTSSKKKMVKP